MRLIYSNGFSEDERHQARAVIYLEIFWGLKAVLEIMNAERIDFETQSHKVAAPGWTYFLSFHVPNLLLPHI